MAARIDLDADVDAVRRVEIHALRPGSDAPIAVRVQVQRLGGIQAGDNPLSVPPHTSDAHSPSLWSNEPDDSGL